MQIKEGKTHRTCHMMLGLTFVGRCTERKNIDHLLTVQARDYFGREHRLRLRKSARSIGVENDAADPIVILYPGSWECFEFLKMEAKKGRNEKHIAILCKMS
jgi:hypothetical protein